MPFYQPKQQKSYYSSSVMLIFGDKGSKIKYRAERFWGLVMKICV